MRRGIVEDLLHRRFDQDEEKWDEDLMKFVDILYFSQFTPEQLKMLDQCPDGWFDTTLLLDFAYQNKWQQKRMSKARRVPVNMHHKSIELTASQNTAYGKLLARKVATDKAKSEASSSAWAVLSSVKTTIQLHEAWPQIKDFIPKDEDKPDITSALTIPMKQLNESLRLP